MFQKFESNNGFLADSRIVPDSLRSEDLANKYQIQIVRAWNKGTRNKETGSPVAAGKTFAWDGDKCLVTGAYDTKINAVIPSTPIMVSCPEELLVQLERVSRDQVNLLVLGRPRFDDQRVADMWARKGWITRTKHEGVHQDGTQKISCFEEVPRSIYMIDFDPKEPELAWLTEKGVDVYTDPDASARVIADAFLPTEISRATLVWQLSSSAGLSKSGERNGSVAKFHFFVMLRSPLMPEDFKALIRAKKDELALLGFESERPAAVLDLSLYNAVHPHYIAAPIFVGGSDPHAKRWGLLKGEIDFADLNIIYADVLPTTAGKRKRQQRHRILTGAKGTRVDLDSEKRDWSPDWRLNMLRIGVTGMHEEIRTTTFTLKREKIETGKITLSSSREEQLLAAKEELAQIDAAIRKSGRTEAKIREKREYAVRSFLEASPRPRYFVERRIAPEFPDTSLPVPLAKERLSTALQAFIDEAARYHTNKKRHAKWIADGCPMPTTPRAFPYEMLLTNRHSIIAAETGLGKTYGALLKLCENVDLGVHRVYVLADTLEKCEELRTEALGIIDRLWRETGSSEAKPSATVFKGRSQSELIDGELVPLCQAPPALKKAAARAEELGVSVKEAVCKKCPLRKSCLWLAQFSDTTPGLKIATKAFLRSGALPGMPTTEKERAAQSDAGAAPIFCVIADEQLGKHFEFEVPPHKIADLTRSQDLPALADFLRPGERETGKVLFDELFSLFRKAVEDAGSGRMRSKWFERMSATMVQDEGRRARLRVLADFLLSMRSETEARLRKLVAESIVTGALDAKELAALRAKIKWWEAFIHLLEQSPARSEIFGLWLEGEKASLSFRDRVPHWLARYPILILDATADEKLDSIPFGLFDVARDDYFDAAPNFTSIKARAEHATRVKVVNAPISRTRLSDLKAEKLRSDSNAAKLLRIVHALGARAESEGGSMGLISYKALEDYARTSKALPTSVRTGHFGAIRGINSFSNTQAVFVVGAHILPPEAIQKRAEGIYAFASECQTLPRGIAMVQRERGLRVRKGKYVEGVAINSLEYPDAMVQRVFEQEAAAEELQSMGRARELQRGKENPVLVMSFNNLVTDTTFDAVIDWRELDGVNEGDAIYHALGVLPDKASERRKLAPGLFSGAGQAKQRAARASATKTARSPIENSSKGPRAVFVAAGGLTPPLGAGEAKKATITLKERSRRRSKHAVWLDPTRADAAAACFAKALGKALVSYAWCEAA